MSGCLHVIGGGLAGLSAALAAAGAGRRVVLYEAGPACGGRARSYEDRQLGCRIDNGNHLLLSGNRATFDYLDRIGARHTLAGPGVPMFPFADISPDRGADLHWTLRLSRGRTPWWVLDPARRVPGMRLRELLSLVRMLRAREGTTVSECLSPGMLADRLLVPLSISVLNTRPEVGSAMLMAAAMRESLAAGGDACIPWFPRLGLSESLVEPALARLRAHGASVRTGCRVWGLGTDRGRVTRLVLPEGEQVLGAGDAVVLAVTAPVAAELLAGPLPGLALPDSFESILNLHYRIALQDHLGGDLARAGFAGIVGGIAEWVFVRPGIVSVTISAANHLAGRDNAAVAAQVWTEISRVLQPALRPKRQADGLVVSLPHDAPPYRVLREKRATFAATTAQQKLRPGSRTDLRNLVLAGDWTDTGLPATIEGAIRSGKTAVRALARP
ncbi:hydroxysqualene dehydroxylase HpnE [Lichenicoccus sp.]|uniref:hydroxysqualene dehydroxylase HpnE n=1 Tax=Lichenicoccus sp. TaxID=2781899 RepID=UPI003D0E3EB3